MAIKRYEQSALAKVFNAWGGTTLAFQNILLEVNFDADTKADIGEETPVKSCDAIITTTDVRDQDGKTKLLRCKLLVRPGTTLENVDGLFDEACEVGDEEMLDMFPWKDIRFEWWPEGVESFSEFGCERN